MAIEKRVGKDGKSAYRVRIAAYDPVTGKRRNITEGTFSTKKDAERAEREALSRRDRGTLLDPSRTTVTELLDEWLRVKANDVTPQSHADYEITCRLHLKPTFGTVPVQKLTADRVQAQYDAWKAAGMSARQVRGCHLRLSQALDYAVSRNIVYTNVCRNTTPPRLASKKPEVWESGEVRCFIRTAAKDSLSPLWHLLVLEGVRRGEGLGLRWKDVNWERGTAHIVQTVAPDKTNHGAPVIQNRTKTRAASRTVKLTSETLTLLKDHRKAQAERRLAASEWYDFDLVICTAKGTPINPNNVSRSFQALVERAGLRRIRVHDLRHTHATMLLKQGMPAKVVSERLGHSSIAITLDTYSHVLPDMQDAAAQAIDSMLAATEEGD